jgi:hypothetical protein
LSTRHISNEEYFQRWENSAPTPVDSNPSPEEIKKMQKRANADKPKWESFAEEMNTDPSITPELQKQIDEYATRVQDSPSNQNKEEVARQTELSAAVAKEYQWVKPDEYNNVEERKGKIMHSSDFIKKLQKAGVKCWYRQHPHSDKLTLMIQRDNLPPEMGCWAQLGFMPELSIMNFDEHGVPLAERMRGWRTCLLQLILKSAITETKADEIFGAPKTTAAFHRYNSTLQGFRNVGGRI